MADWADSAMVTSAGRVGETVIMIDRQSTQTADRRQCANGASASYRSGLDDSGQVRNHAVGARRRDRDARLGGLDHLAVAEVHRDALRATGAVAEQVAGARLRGRNLAADIALLTRGPRHLEPGAGIGVLDQT